jgi:hypothetical protein
LSLRLEEQVSDWHCVMNIGVNRNNTVCTDDEGRFQVAELFERHTGD